MLLIADSFEWLPVLIQSNTTNFEVYVISSFGPLRLYFLVKVNTRLITQEIEVSMEQDLVLITKLRYTWFRRQNISILNFMKSTVAKKNFNNN